MILIAILISLVAIGALCWLLFTLAAFALPAFIGFSLAIWTYHTGAGILGALIVGMVGAVLTLALGQSLLIVVRPTWARLLIVLIFVAPAALAGYHATHGIVKHTMPSEAWQFIFSVIGAVAVGTTAYVRVAGLGLIAPTDRRLARA